MREKLFIVVLKYIVELEQIIAFRKVHLEYLDKYYTKAVFLASGRQNPKFGGVIIAKAESRKKLYEIEVQCYVVQIISALRYLHTVRVIHRE